MTKKRRNLRILASIIAAGCVWATGIGNAWAAGSSIVPAQAANYVAFGLTAAEKANLGENNLANTKEVKIGEVVYKYNLEKVTYQNANNETETTHYWVRDGYGITVNEGMFHEEASNNRHIDVYQTTDYADSVPREQNIVFTGNSATQVTDVATAINKDNLYKLSYKQFTGLSNSNSTGVGENSCFYIERDGKFVNVGGYNQETGAASDSKNATFVRENFYAFNESTDDYNSVSGKYKFKGKDVEYDNVYSVTFKVVDPDDGTKNVTKHGVFLTQPKGSGSDPYANCEVYTGPVYGRNNEILVTAFDQTANTWSTVWGAGVTDPNATIGNMKLAHFNEILSEIHDEDVKLAMADVEKAKVTASGTGGSVDLINKKGNTVPGFTMNSAGGIKEDTYVTVSDGEQGSFRLNTGSVVKAGGLKTVANGTYFNTLNINDLDYKVESVSGIELTQDDNGNLVVNLTTNAGNTINSNAINIGDFIIDYGNGIPGEQGPPGQTGEQGQSGQSGTGNQTTIEQAINNNYTNITNNTTEINEINKNNVTNVTKQVTNDDRDIWEVTQTVNGIPTTVQITDEHINSHVMAINGDNIESKITTNFGGNFEQSVRVGNATINYDGDIGTQNNSSIEEAINNNYNKVVNVENNYVSNIVRKDEHTWKVIQGGQETVTIKDTTLVEKNLFGKDANGNKVSAIDIIVPRALTPDADGNYDAEQVAAYQRELNRSGLVGFVDKNGIPEIVMEFQDTSGNVVQGAVDFGTLFAESLKTEGDDNIIVTPRGGGLGNYGIALANDITVDNVTVNNSVTVANKVTVNSNGVDMGDTKITNLADGEISANSTDAINGSQLWETNRNMDKLGGRLDKVGAGAAALAALHPLDFDPDDKLQFSAGVGNYKGETAAALGAFYRPTEKVMFSVAGTMGNGENMVNAGVTFALDRKNNVSNSRVAMAHEIQDLRDQVAALTALVSQIAGKGNPLLDTVMFPDVPENHWAYDYVENLQKRGIIEGYPDGNFGGDHSMTRYEYAAMLYRALEKGFPVDGRLLKEFEAELGRIRIDRIKGADDDANKVERVRVNDYEDRDDYGSKLAQVVADAAPAIEEEPAA